MLENVSPILKAKKKKNKCIYWWIYFIIFIVLDIEQHNETKIKLNVL